MDVYPKELQRHLRKSGWLCPGHLPGLSLGTGGAVQRQGPECGSQNLNVLESLQLGKRRQRNCSTE